MKRLGLPLGALLGCMAACVPGLPQPLVVRYNVPDERFWPREKSELADLARAANLPPLSVAHLPPGARELRISDGYSMFQGGVVPAVRVVEQDGMTRGEVLYFWDEADPPSRLRSSSCSHDDRARVCVYRVPDSEAPDWQKVGAELNRLGAWDIHENCIEMLGTISLISDGGELIMERREKDVFSRYSCNGPSFREETKAGHQAAAIYHYFGTLVLDHPRR
ncbi:MAG TPA: hypothetical protein VJW73_19155 [Gemmatimonadaceae bacterium]|nr:hypothetical protein [Gemmatimonadaceae bacterium]